MTAPYCGPIQAGWRCRLGPLVMTGLAALGAAVGIGWLYASTWIPTHEPTDRRVLTGRSLALVSMAFCEGIAVLGVVVGILAVMTDGQIAQTDRLFAAGPAVVGAVIGLGLVVRHRQTADPRLVPHAVVFIVGLANLGIVVALLAYILGEDGPKHPIEGPFVILGLVSLASALAIGRTGARAVRSLERADEIASKAIQAKQIARNALFQIAGVGASIIAVVLILAR